THVDSESTSGAVFTMTAAISGIGAWYPEPVRTNDIWPKKMARSQAIDGDRTFNDIPCGLGSAAEVTERYLAIEAQDPFLGVRERRVAPDELGSIDAEVFAAELALEDAGIHAND